MLKKVISMILLVSITGLLLSSCKKEQPLKPQPTEEPRRELEPMLNAETELQKNLLPFWRMNTMYDECVSMIKRDDGSITANMLFKPTKIISVKDYSLKKEYVRDVDYTWDENTNVLVWKEGSKIPYFTQDDLHGIDEDGKPIPAWGSSDNPWDKKGRSRFKDALYCVGEFLYAKQISVTYEYTYGDWQASITEYQGDRIPKTINKLKNGETIKLVFYGDSIFEGNDASSVRGREPKMPIMPILLDKALEEKYGGKVQMYNTSKGGMDSAWAVDNTEERATKKNPDLLIIGFGMNDGNKEGNVVAANIKKIIDTVKSSNPDCEFMVVVPMVPNDDAGFLTTHVSFSEEFAKLAGDGIAFVDMFSIHSDIIKVKDYVATSGNNINHPNDWLIRVYVQNILSAMIEY